MEWVKYCTVKPSGDGLEMQIRNVWPEGPWYKIGDMYRDSDGQHFIVIAQGLYAGQVDEDKLSADIAEFLGLGKRVL